MFTPWSRNLELTFHEAGYDTYYNHGTDGYKPSRSCKVLNGDTPNHLRIEPHTGESITDTSLYAAFVALRTGCVVEFCANGIDLQVDGAEAVDYNDLDDMTIKIIENRFTNINGTGNLTDEQKITIGLMAKKLTEDYMAPQK